MGQKFGSDIIKPLQYSAPNVILPSGSRVTIGGQQYLIGSNLQVALSGLTANTLYFVYAQVSVGVVSLTYLASVPSANTDKKLVGAFYSDSSGVGSFVPIEGSPESEPITFTPTGSWTTNTTYTGKWRRVRDFMEVEIGVELSGAPGGTTTLSVNIPSGGHTIDTAKFPFTPTADVPALGIGKILDFGVAGYQGFVYYIDTTSVGLAALNATGSYTVQNGVNFTTPTIFGASDRIGFTFCVPISGWTNTPLKDL